MFTQQELMAIIKICDAGVRAGGLEVADLAVPICHKIRTIMQQSQQGNGSMRRIEDVPERVER